MRPVLRSLAFVLGMLTISPYADARMGVGGWFGFSGGFRGSAGSFVSEVPSGHVTNGLRRQFLVHRERVGAEHFRGPRMRRDQAFKPSVGLFDDTWWPDVTEVVTYASPPEEPVQPQIVIIQRDKTESKLAEAPPDYGYVAGCHAIPNGYHCDAADAVR